MRFVRLLCVLGIGAGAVAVAKVLGCPPLFFLAPCLMVLVHTILWDLCKCRLLDVGFFRFLKLIVLVGAFVVLTKMVATDALARLTPEFFDVMNTELSDLQMLAVCGAVAMLSFTFVLCLGCMQSFGNRFVGLAVAPLGIALGLLTGFISLFGGAISVGIAKILTLAILLLPAGVLIAYLKEQGLRYADLPMGAAFAGLGLESRSSRGGAPASTGDPMEDAMRAIAWGASDYVELFPLVKLKIEVSVSVYSYAIEFRVDGKVYNENTSLTTGNINQINETLANRLHSTQRRILSQAHSSLQTVQRKYPEQYQDRDYDIRVDIGSIDA